ncbi:SPFH domain-containing protein [Candidatus Woesearchaeota archaeon]|nr:SPFH domain-containing protein [Candidatus Woesearchaeota archaeon]
MGLISELMGQLERLKFAAIVNEYEQGLYLRNGTVVPVVVRMTASELETILEDENKIVNENGGTLAFIFPTFYKFFSRNRKEISLPEGYQRTSFLGLPQHPKRFERSKVLKPGLYFYIPLIDRIVTSSQQEDVLNLGYISIPSNDDNAVPMVVSANLRFQVMDFYRAYTAVHDYENSLRDHALSILAKHSRKLTYDNWKSSEQIENLQGLVARELRDIVTSVWGIKIHKVYITDNVSAPVKRLLLGDGHDSVPGYNASPIVVSATQ